MTIVVLYSFVFRLVFSLSCRSKYFTQVLAPFSLGLRKHELFLNRTFEWQNEYCTIRITTRRIDDHDIYSLYINPSLDCKDSQIVDQLYPILECQSIRDVRKLDRHIVKIVNLCVRGILCHHYGNYELLK